MLRADLNKGAVIKHITTGRIYVIGMTISLEKVMANLDEYKYLGDRPHFDGDFSYLCGSDYCRCMQ